MSWWGGGRCLQGLLLITKLKVMKDNVPYPIIVDDKGQVKLTRESGRDLVSLFSFSFSTFALFSLSLCSS
jgi:hypothetical protein